jgi:hypothetical protein
MASESGISSSDEDDPEVKKTTTPRPDKDLGELCKLLNEGRDAPLSQELLDEFDRAFQKVFPYSKFRFCLNIQDKHSVYADTVREFTFDEMKKKWISYLRLDTTDISQLTIKEVTKLFSKRFFDPKLYYKKLIKWYTKDDSPIFKDKVLTDKEGSNDFTIYFYKRENIKDISLTVEFVK